MRGDSIRLGPLWRPPKSDYQPVQADRPLERYAYQATELMAPYRGGALPTVEMLRPVRCHNLGPRGGTVITMEPPDCDRVVLRFGSKSHAIDLTAEVVGCTPIDNQEVFEFRVDLRFLGRVYLS